MDKARIRISKPLYGKDRLEYFAHSDLIVAANAALALGAPLLLTGEPGCGKTQFAWAIASAIQRKDGQRGNGSLDFEDPLECYVRSDTRARDLLYHYDAMRRFGDTQLSRDGKPSPAHDARNYVELQALGRALMASSCKVVLIDEIDKAPRDLPNDLLRELEQGDFDIPELAQTAAGTVNCHSSGIPLQRTMRRSKDAPKPFIVITSNVERQLPDAFLRRCIFYHIRFPDREQLQKILRANFLPTPKAARTQGRGAPPAAPLSPAEQAFRMKLIDDAQHIFGALRTLKLTKRPATAELIHWVDALIAYASDWDSASALGQIATAIGTRTADALVQATIPWNQLPALGCLIKLREDLDRLLPQTA